MLGRSPTTCPILPTPQLESETKPCGKEEPKLISHLLNKFFCGRSISITPSCILFFLGCSVFSFLLFLSLFSQHWNCVELAAQSRGSGWFGIDLGGFLRGPAFYPRDTWTYIFLVCLLCSIPQSFLRSAWPCEQADRGSYVNC